MCIRDRSFTVWFLYRLLRFYFRFPAFLGGGFCYSDISSRRYTPAALLASLKYAYSPCVLSSFLSCVVDVDLSLFFSSLPSLFRFRFGHRLFHPVIFLWVLCCLLGFGFCCDSGSIWYVSWYVRTQLSPFYFCLRYTICFSYCVYYLLLLFVFLLRWFSAPELLEPVLWPVSYTHLTLPTIYSV